MAKRKFFRMSVWLAVLVGVFFPRRVFVNDK
jgi:hypothetical protein